MDTLFALRGLTVSYPNKPVVRGVDLDVAPGETIALVGESGSGKTQAMLAALGLLGTKADIGGSAKLQGTELVGATETTLNALRGSAVAMIFQEPLSALDPLYTVGDQIAAPMIAHSHAPRRDAWRQAQSLLDEVGIGSARARAYPHELSGGERQRVMIAMAVANKPALIVADEPTTALDVTIEAQIIALLSQLIRRLGSALIFISHDLGLVRRIADRIYVMRDGVVVESGPTGIVLSRPRTVYARTLLWAVPSGVKAPAMPRGPVILSTSALTVDYGGDGLLFRPARRRALARVDLEIFRGRTLGVVGESGSGKSSLARAILRLIPAGGAIRFEGRDLQVLSEAEMRPLRRCMQIVFQDPFASLSPRMSVGAIVSEGLRVHEPRLGAAERDARAAKALEEVGVDPDTRSRTPDAFSGGQRQRIAIARALILRPSLLVLDEPTSSLDRSVQRAILDLLARLQESHGLTYLFISHDLAVVRAFADDLIVLHKGQVLERGATEQIFTEPREPYTRALIKAARGRGGLDPA